MSTPSESTSCSGREKPSIAGKPSFRSALEEDEELRASLLQAKEYHLDESANKAATKFKFADAVNKFVYFQKGEAETIRRVLDEIELLAVKRTSEGFNEFNFSVGVLNCFFLCFMFGAHPEHLWLVYLVEGLYMIPRKFYNMCCARPLNQALYYLDFCWAMNFAAIFVIFTLILSGIRSGNERIVSNFARKSFFSASLGVSCGPLVGANIVLPFVACLFHDVNTMTGLFIHLMPPMVMYTFMWHSADIKEAWPSVFHLTYMDEVHYFPKSDPFSVPGSGKN